MLASRDFFQELRQAICYELEHDGFCTLVDDLLEHPPSKMDVVACVVFYDLANKYPSGQLTDVKNSYCVPNLSILVSWEECSHMEYQSVPMDGEKLMNVRRARDVVREGHLRYLKTLTEAQPTRKPQEIPITPVPACARRPRPRQRRS